VNARQEIEVSRINSNCVFNIQNQIEVFFAFESQFTFYQQFIIGTLPRVDLVIQSKKTGICLQGLEVKLTALPDNSTCELPEYLYGCELVARPDTIVYLACRIANLFKDNTDALNKIIDSVFFETIKDWSDGESVLAFIPRMIDSLENLSSSIVEQQSAFLLQPIWKTLGKSSQLAEHCLDLFVWSDLGFMQLFLDMAKTEKYTVITRQARCVIWLFKMLLEFGEKKQINSRKIIDQLSYNTKNDKAFAVNGRITNRYMACPELIKPRVTKQQIKEIILGGGQNLLSPERRFDAILYNSPDIF